MARGKGRSLEGGSKGLVGFLQILDEMEREGQKEKPISGEIAGPFGTRAAYDLLVVVGIEDPHRVFRRR